MKLFEFEAKNILQKYGLSIPSGSTARTPAEVKSAAARLNKPVVIKSQILVAGRGKGGGILFADNPEKAEEFAARLLGSSIMGIRVETILVEEKLEIARQYYLSIAIDRQECRYIAMASTEGGVDIEHTAQSNPEKIVRSWIDPFSGLNITEILKMLGKLNIELDDQNRLADIFSVLYQITMDTDAEMVELNPLVKTESGMFTAADARIIIDDNALFRHPEFSSTTDLERGEMTPLEASAKKQGLQYIDLPGDIGIVGNGAGLVMATVDLVQLFGGKPANFLDIGGGGNVDITKRGLLLVLNKPGVKAVLINILGGITRCDVVAQAVIEGLKEAGVKKPIAVRMMGTNYTEGTRMLHEAGVFTYESMEEAVKAVLKY